jgi:hypothetical protein
MRSFFRIFVMLIVTAFTLIMQGGGYKNSHDFSVVALTGLYFLGLPLIAIVTLLHFLEGWLGRYGRYYIASLGLWPLLLILYAGRGDPKFSTILVLAGVGWSVIWIATAFLFRKPSQPL